jgi:hypothetical protein
MDLQARQDMAQTIFRQLRAKGVREVSLRHGDGGLGFTASDRAGKLTITVDPPMLGSTGGTTPAAARPGAPPVPGSPGPPSAASPPIPPPNPI